jgi:hypothetical protein
MIADYKKVKKLTSLFQNAKDLSLIDKQIEKKHIYLQNLYKTLFLIKNNWKNVLYIDTPFCEQRCRFCVYFRYIPRDHAEISNFYNKIINTQIHEYQEVLEKTKFQQVVFGGGTPTIVSPQVLERLFLKIPNFKKIRSKIIEASPSSLTDGHIDLFRKNNFTTISIGVQTFSSGLLKKQGRSPLDIKKLKHFCKKIERYGMISSIDLILFLDESNGTDLLQEKKDLEYALSEIRPIEISLHTKYAFKRTNKKDAAAIKLIKEMLIKYPEYICVNSLLQKKEEKNQTYRLMRKFLNYTFYLQSVTPYPGNYGYNVFPLGFYGNHGLWSTFYNFYFEIMTKVSFWLFPTDKPYFKKYKYYKTFVDTRKKLGLYYDKFNKKDFFIKKTDRIKFQKILKRIRKINKTLLELYSHSKVLKGKIKERIKRFL